MTKHTPADSELTPNESVFLIRFEEKLKANGLTQEEINVLKAVKRKLNEPGEASSSDIIGTIDLAKSDIYKKAQQEQTNQIAGEKKYQEDVKAYQESVREAANVDPSKTKVKIARNPGTHDQFLKRNPEIKLDVVQQHLNEIEAPKLVSAVLKENNIKL